MSRRKALNCTSYFSLCCHFHKQVQVKLAFSLLEKGFIFKIFIDTFRKKDIGENLYHCLMILADISPDFCRFIY